jgi:RNA polymerase sigma-70 factor (ECF subfamily)
MGLEQAAVIEILLRERIRISGSVLSIVRDAHAVDDIFQQVALKALQTRDPFAEPEHVLAWALRTARHRAIDLLRARKAQCLDEAVLDLLEQHWALAPSEDVSARVEALQYCVGELPEHSRSLLRLRYEEGLPCAGMAARLRRSVDAVYQSLSRVHRRLRLCVEHRLAASDGPSLPERQPLGGALT